MNADGQRVLKFPIGEKLYRPPLFQKARLEQEVGFHHGISWETIEISNMDDLKVFFKWVTKPPFGKASLEGHLPSLKTGLGPSAGTGVLTFGASAGRLAMPRPNPSSHPFPLLPCSLRRFQFFQLHPGFLSDPFTTSNRCSTRLIIPRIWGRSGKVRV
jgi:hypothetical protein